MQRIHQIHPNMFKRMNRKGRYVLLVIECNVIYRLYGR